MNTVDLNKAFEGSAEAFTTVLLTLKSGEEAHVMVEKCKDGTFSVRYENGWWVGYKANGERERPPEGDLHRRDIVKVYSCKYKEGMSCGFHP